MQFTYLELFSATIASILDVSKIDMAAKYGSIFWQIGSFRSTRWANMDCKSGKKSCINHEEIFYLATKMLYLCGLRRFGNA